MLENVAFLTKSFLLLIQTIIVQKPLYITILVYKALKKR